MLGVPATTDFDLNFRLLGIPIRVHPLFWVLAALLGWSGRDGGQIVVWVACVFVSILVHEFGHGLTARALARQEPRIILYAMGGLCVYDREHRSPWGRVAILLMGPGAGFLLFLVVALVGTGVLGIAPFPVPPEMSFFHQPPAWASPLVFEAYFDLAFINLVWGFFNLLPIFPLDGGQITQAVLTMNNPREGAKRSYIVSMGIAAVLATYLYQRDDVANALLVGYLGLINFQYFQATRFQTTYGGGFEQDDNWWRK